MILVTGVPGWLSNRFLELIATEYKDFSRQKIRCLVLPSSDITVLKGLNLEIEFTEGDLSEKMSLEKFFKGSEGSILFHIAGIIHPEGGIKSLYEVNVGGTMNVMDLAVKSGVKKVILLSSNSQSGCNPSSEHLFTEESPYNPYLNYGKSKMIMEQVVNKYAGIYDLDTTIIRPCWYYGPHQPARQTSFFSMIKNGKFPIVGDGTNRRSMSYVDSVSHALIQVCKNDISKGKTYWISDERPYTMIEIVETVQDVLENDFGMEVNRNVRRLPNFFGVIAYGLDYCLQGMGFYNKEIHALSELNKNIACSVEKARKELGYNPSISLREGMRRSVEWCLQNNQVI